MKVLCAALILSLVTCCTPCFGRLAPPGDNFRRADMNVDGSVDLSDAVGTFTWLFLGGDEPSCVDAADSNDDGAVDLSDGVFTLNYLFAGGEQVPAPGTDRCGPDRTPDQIGCESFDLCRCDGVANLECSDGEFCDLEPGSCAAGSPPGMCVAVPDACPRLWDPVCGCDGETYANDCERIRAGAQLDYVGECEASNVCGGIAGVPCDRGELCDLPPGSCGAADLQGVCVPIPEVCPDVWDPVCGCDGRTYGNDCERLAAGVQLDHVGECESPNVCGGFAGTPCDEGQFCDLPPGLCGGADLPGDCVPIPDICPRLWDPVCGCDGRTYANDCERIRAGVQLDHVGECESPNVCGGFAGTPCDEGQFCDLPPGLCGGADLQGECVPIPDLCPDLWDPVCGCDGRTYANDCERIRAGVQKDHDGSCDGDPR